LLLSFARKSGVKLFVYTSSPSVVFNGVDQCGIDESAPYDYGWMEDHRAYYSHTKASAEQAVLSANCEEFRTCALRPHLIWGPGDTHLIPRLLARARSGRLRRVGDGANHIDITYVENAADAHLRAADAMRDAAADEVTGAFASPCGKKYFISQGEPVNCWQWIDEVLALAGLPPVRKRISAQAASRLGGALESICGSLGISTEPPMTRFLASQLSTSHWFNISAARRDFGFEPRVSTPEGMQRLAGWLNRSS
jgi:nucleoside-diphosphate-sugar epimerase